MRKDIGVLGGGGLDPIVLAMAMVTGVRYANGAARTRIPTREELAIQAKRRERDEWNREVEQRKADKKARKEPA